MLNGKEKHPKNYQRRLRQNKFRSIRDSAQIGGTANGFPARSKRKGQNPKTNFTPVREMKSRKLPWQVRFRWRRIDAAPHRAVCRSARQSWAWCHSHWEVAAGAKGGTWRWCHANVSETRAYHRRCSPSACDTGEARSDANAGTHEHDTWDFSPSISVFGLLWTSHVLMSPVCLFDFLWLDPSRHNKEESPSTFKAKLAKALWCNILWQKHAVAFTGNLIDNGEAPAMLQIVTSRSSVRCEVLQWQFEDRRWIRADVYSRFEPLKPVAAENLNKGTCGLSGHVLGNDWWEQGNSSRATIDSHQCSIHCWSSSVAPGASKRRWALQTLQTLWRWQESDYDETDRDATNCTETSEVTC